MPNVRVDRLSTNDVSRVRAALGITQQTLAYYLGVQRDKVAQVECGQRVGFPLTTDTTSRIVRLQWLLPPPAGVAPLDPAPVCSGALAVGPGPAGLALSPGPVPDPVRRAVANVAHNVLVLRRELEARIWEEQVAYWQERVAAGLRVPPDTTFYTWTDRRPARTLWLANHLAANAAEARHLDGRLNPATLTHLRLRLWLAETEAAALAGWVATNSA